MNNKQKRKQRRNTQANDTALTPALPQHSHLHIHPLFPHAWRRYFQTMQRVPLLLLLLLASTLLLVNTSLLVLRLELPLLCISPFHSLLPSHPAACGFIGSRHRSPRCISSPLLSLFLCLLLRLSASAAPTLSCAWLELRIPLLGWSMLPTRDARCIFISP